MRLGWLRPGPAAWRFIRDVAAYRRGRLLSLTLLGATSAALQGAGLVLLAPLLSLLGREGDAWRDAVPKPLATLEGALLVYLLIVIGAAWFARNRAVASSRLRLQFVDALRVRLHLALLGIEWKHFVRLRSSDIQQTIMNETARAGIAVEQFTSLIAAAFVIPIMLAVAGSLSIPLTLLTLAIAGLVWLLSIPLNRRSSRLGHEASRIALAANAALAEDLANLRAIRSFAAEPVRAQAFADRLDGMRRQHLALVAATGTSKGIVRAAGAAVAAICLVLATRRLGMPLPQALVFILAFARLVVAALGMQDNWRRLLHSVPAYDQAQALLRDFEAHREAVHPRGEALPLYEQLDAQAVAFRYSDEAEPALRGLDCVIPAGKMTAVVGASGSGKSTLADLLLGLLKPEAGAIRADDIALDDLARSAWRRGIGYVPQEPVLLHDTMRANLLLAQPAASEDDIWEALDLACAAGVVRRLPQGLDTIVGDRGSRLSGGERQRLTITRALLRRPRLLLLDEATSALDPATERDLIASLRTLVPGITIVAMTHRRAIVEAADHVIALESGRVVAEGTWHELAQAVADIQALQ